MEICTCQNAPRDITPSPSRLKSPRDSELHGKFALSRLMLALERKGKRLSKGSGQPEHFCFNSISISLYKKKFSFNVNRSCQASQRALIKYIPRMLLALRRERNERVRRCHNATHPAGCVTLSGYSLMYFIILQQPPSFFFDEELLPCHQKGFCLQNDVPLSFIF